MNILRATYNAQKIGIIMGENYKFSNGSLRRCKETWISGHISSCMKINSEIFSGVLYT